MGKQNGLTDLFPVLDFDSEAGFDYHPSSGLIVEGNGGHVLVAGGAENELAPTTDAERKGSFVGGLVVASLPTLGDGDFSLLHFDTTGRLLVDSEGVTVLDNNNVVVGQTTSLSIVENYMFDTVQNHWIRFEGGLDKTEAAPTPVQALFVGGKVVATPLVTDYTDGQVSSLNFDTFGRLRVATEESVLEADDDAVPTGQSHTTIIDLNYFVNLDATAPDQWQRLKGRNDDDTIPYFTASPNGGAPGILGLSHADDSTQWRRLQVRSVSGAANEALMSLLTRSSVMGLDNSAAAGSQSVPVNARNADNNNDFVSTLIGLVTNSRKASFLTGSDWVRDLADLDDNNIASGQTTALVINENYVFDGTKWIAQEGGTDDTPAPAVPQGTFTAGKVITSFPGTLVAGDVAVDRMTVDGAKLTIPRTQEPFQVAKAAATTVPTTGAILGLSPQVDSLFLGSLGRTLLHGVIRFTGGASAITLEVQVSVDGGLTYFTVDTLTVNPGAGNPTVIRSLSVALGDHVQVKATAVTATATGVDYGFYLTHAN